MLLPNWELKTTVVDLAALWYWWLLRGRRND
jgi:hypothetical protein